MNNSLAEMKSSLQQLETTQDNWKASFVQTSETLQVESPTVTSNRITTSTPTVCSTTQTDTVDSRMMTFSSAVAKQQQVLPIESFLL